MRGTRGKRIAQIARKHRADLIVITAHLPVQMALAAQKTGIPILMVLQDVEFEKHGGAFEELGQVACVANSNFTADRYRKAFNVTPSVVYPFISAKKYRTDTRRKNVTLINPHPKKGRDIAIQIARQCLEIPFAFVKSWPLSSGERRELDTMLATAPNVTFVPPQNDMRNVYADCKILLAPSVWEEAYGRVATEAQLSGIPVIASTRGGLPEAVGPGGIVLDPEQPISDWVTAVRKLWTDQGYYSALSAAATRHADRPEIAFDRQIEAFETAMLDAGRISGHPERKLLCSKPKGFACIYILINRANRPSYI